MKHARLILRRCMLDAMKKLETPNIVFVLLVVYFTLLGWASVYTVLYL